MGDTFTIRLEGGPLGGSELSGQDCRPSGPIQVAEAFGGGSYEYDRDEDGVQVWVPVSQGDSE